MATSKKEDEKIRVIHIPLAWLDSGIRTDNNEVYEKQMHSNFGRCRLFSDLPRCKGFIENENFHPHLVLVVSGQLGSELVPSIHDNSNVSAIYIYCGNIEAHKKWADGYSKVRAVLNDFDQLIAKIRKDHDT